MFYGLALCASLFALFMKARLIVYKLRKRRSENSGLMCLVFNADVGERLDVHRQRMTRALLYLLLAVSEVCNSLRLARRYCRRPHLLCSESQDLPCSILTTLFILSSSEPPSMLVLLSFATSLLYLGCVCRFFSALYTLPNFD